MKGEQTFLVEHFEVDSLKSDESLIITLYFDCIELIPKISASPISW
jgi:hypothetical protein